MSGVRANTGSGDIEGLEEAGAVHGLLLEGLEAGEEGGLGQFLEAHDAAAHDLRLGAVEILRLTVDVHEQEPAVRTAVTDDADVIEGEGGFAFLRGERLVDLRGEEVLAAAQQQVGHHRGVRRGDRGGGGIIRDEHGIVSRRFAPRVSFVKWLEIGSCGGGCLRVLPRRSSFVNKHLEYE